MQSNKAVERVRKTFMFNYSNACVLPSFSFFGLGRIDSAMLVEEGFEVVSVDASDKMLKYALKERWNRRKESGFDSWSKHTNFPSSNIFIVSLN